MIGFIVQIIGSILGLVGFFSREPSLVIIGGIICLIVDLLGFFYGALRNLLPGILALATGALISGFLDMTPIQGALFGICAETLVGSVLGIIMLIKVNRLNK